MRLSAAATGLVLIAVLAHGCQRHEPASSTSTPTTTSADDPYIWLEDVQGAKPLEWAKEQSAKTRAILAARPRFKDDYEALLAQYDASDRIPYVTLDHQYAFNFWQDAQHPKGLWRRAAIGDYGKRDVNWETLLDVDRLAAQEKENWVWGSADCAPSLARCLVSLSRGGRDAQVVREFDLVTKTFAADGFTVNEAKTRITYVDDDSVLVASDFGPGSMTTSGYPRSARLWRRGQPLGAAVTVAEAKPTDVRVRPRVVRSASGNVPLVLRSTSFFDTEYLAIAADGTWKPLPLPTSVNVAGIVQGQLVFRLLKPWTPGGDGIHTGAPTTFAEGSLVACSFDEWRRTGRLPPIALLYAPTARTALNDIITGRDAVYVSLLDNVIGGVRVYRPRLPSARTDGPVSWKEETLVLPSNGSAGIIAANNYGPEVFLGFESFLVPPTVLAGGSGNTPVAVRSLQPRFDASRYVTEQLTAASKDGTTVPYFVVRTGNHHGPSPTLLYGYGGFEVPAVPFYLEGLFQRWVEQGGSFVVANIRGGGEFGPAWHDAAVGAHRQRAFDDFAAVARDLSARGLTTPKQLGLVGASNGGLLVTTVMTQAPDAVGAVVSQVPLVDMLRYTKIGAGASWIGEYGDPADAAAAAVLRDYSPYQNVAAGRRYPPVLFVTTTSDDRVTPAHARKMAARMTAQGHDVLFFESTDGGHGPGDHKQTAETDALVLQFLQLKLGAAGGARSN